MTEKIAAILLAGGNSTRMGTNKALLQLDNTLMYEKVLGEIEKITPHIFISSNHELPLKKYPIIADTIKNKGPMSGIFSVLEKNSFNKYIVVCCDAPFIKKELIELLLTEHCETAVVPNWENKTYPFPGIYSSNLKNVLLKHIENNQLKMKYFLKTINAKEIVITSEAEWMSKNIFLNINTPEEYKNLYPCN